MLEDLGRQIVVEVAKEALKEPAKEVGSEIADLLRILFTPLQMAKIFRDAWLDDFKARILKKFEQIPIDRQISPPLEVIGPAIESSRYFIQQERMREYFANLIAHSCDSETVQAIHPAFVFFLTQMTSLDAEIIQLFRIEAEVKIGLSVGNRPDHPAPVMNGTGIKHYPERFLPVVNYNLIHGTEMRTIYRNVLELSEMSNVDAVSASIANLMRMGLIDVNYARNLATSSYAWAFQNSIHNELFRYTKAGRRPEGGFTMRVIRGTPLVEGTFDQLTIEKGVAHLTQLGYDFYKCCILEQDVVNKNS